MERIKSIDENCKEIEKELIKKFNSNSRIAIVGVGNEFRYDDIAGLQVVRNIKKQSKDLKPKLDVLLVEGETAPHTFINEIYEWSPTHLIMLDAADLREPPGTIEFIHKDQIDLYSISSHSMSKNLLIDFLYASLLELDITIIAIQAENIFHEKGISETVKIAVEKLTHIFMKFLYE
ncbi:MAG: hydrogenase maturation protease [Promethearchaeota archaeon]